MAYLNEQQRAQLRDELKNLKFNQAKGRLRRMDPKARLVFYRNSQQVGRWLTRYDLESLGTRVTLVEQNRVSSSMRSEWELVDVKVEPTPDNRL
ncbi:MAG: hypothetical protein DWB42_20190 [Chloroflexi bacterium]|jgi:hypothetical protein|nr:hypothetical protein [Chloroflexota bacterium]MDL1886108.1 hypothetical protein [Anaerolineae bacterium CFX8]